MVNRELEAKARALAGIKGYITNLAAYRPIPTALSLTVTHGQPRLAARTVSKLGRQSFPS